MIVGFNHNILYRGVGFHVQTEDSGLKSPSLVTLLYHGGIIVSSQKTSYADILDVDNLAQVVEELAKEQHKGMLRRLTKGEFDQQIRELGIETEADKSAVAESAGPLDDEAGHRSADEIEDLGSPPVAAVPLDLPVAIEPAYEPSSDEGRAKCQDITAALDDLIFSYLTGGDESG
jgi:hypothetical protein